MVFTQPAIRVTVVNPTSLKSEDFMLVLSRKEGERISIGPEIEVTVLGIHKGRARFGFVGPREVPIHREELQGRIGPDQSSHLTATPPKKGEY